MSTKNEVGKTWKMRLFIKLMKWSERKFRNEYLELYKCDLLCDNCDTWYSVSGIDHNHALEDLEYLDGTSGYKTICGKCRNPSYWCTSVAPVAIRCGEKGLM